MEKTKNKSAVSLGKKSWEARKATQGSDYFKALAKKRWKNKKKTLSTPKKKKSIV